MLRMSTVADPRGGRPVVPSRGALRPLGLGEIRLTDGGGFWTRRQRTNREATLDHGRTWLDKLGWTGNFTTAESGHNGGEPRRGREFSDSEVYKWLEAMAWDTGRLTDPDRELEIGELTALVGAAQSADGYLHTAYGRPGQPPRYSDLTFGHELYCMGHLIQAAVARARTAGDDPLLGIARRAADHVCVAFGRDGLEGVCGHPEIEPALVELARVTGEQRYLDQAALFVHRRGQRTLPQHHFGWQYFSDDIPVRQATVLRGHAVRALYLSAGAVDVAVETGDDDLLAAVVAQFDRTLARRTYLTGGMGSHHADESFGEDFVLPADRSYSETCAAIAAIMLSWRLLLATGERRYGDVIERLLYNVVATSIGDDGRSFFYANTLHQRTPTESLPTDRERLGFGGGPRAPWFEVSCCLPNIARLLASLSTYLVTADDDGLQIHQYADADAATTLPDGRRVGLRMRTAYPDDGAVTLTVTDAPGDAWGITLRIPAWAAGATVAYAAAEGPAAPAHGEPVGPGSATVRRAFVAGDEIRLALPVRPRWTFPDPRIDAVRGCVAVERGPIVLCAESTDQNGADLDDLRVDVTLAPDDGAESVTVRGHAIAPYGGSWPYGDSPAEPVWPELRGSQAHSSPPTDDPSPTPVRLTPYHRWARRGPSTMRVWLPIAPEGDIRETHHLGT
jgi:DUF1680 family protein